MEKNDSQIFIADKNELCIFSTTENFHIVSKGQLNGKLKEQVNPIIKKIWKDATTGKMCTFYVIKCVEKFLVYFSLSGFSKKNINQTVRENCKRFNNVTFIPMAEEQIEKVIEPNSAGYRTDRNNLFQRFLWAVTNNVETSAEYKRLKDKFLLNDNEHKEAIKFISKSTTKGGEAYQIYMNNKKDLGKNASSQIEFLLNLFYKFQEYDVIQDLNKYVDDIDIFKNENGELNRINRISCHLELKKYYSLFEQPECYIKNLKILAEALQNFDNIAISNKLAHCSETNLLYYLYDNPDILSVPGHHYIFSIRLRKEDIENALISDLCEVCNVNFIEHFKYLLNQQGLSSRFKPNVILPVTNEDENPINNSLEHAWEDKIEAYHQKNAEYFCASHRNISVFFKPNKEAPDSEEKSEKLKIVREVMEEIGSVRSRYDNYESFLAEQERKYDFKNAQQISVKASKFFDAISNLSNEINAQSNNTNQEIHISELDLFSLISTLQDDDNQENSNASQDEEENQETIKHHPR